MLYDHKRLITVTAPHSVWSSKTSDVENKFKFEKEDPNLELWYDMSEEDIDNVTGKLFV